MHPAYDEPDEKSIELRIREELFHSLAKTIHILFQMKEQYPETYKFIEDTMYRWQELVGVEKNSFVE